MHIHTNANVHTYAREALKRMLNNPHRLVKNDWLAVTHALFTAESYIGSNLDPIAQMQSSSIASFLNLMQRIVAHLTSVNSEANDWFVDNRYGISKQDQQQVHNEMQDASTHTSNLTATQATVVNPGIEAVGMIADTNRFLVLAWMEIEKALRLLYSYDVRPRDDHVEHLIQFFLRSINVLKQRSPATADWYATSKAHFEEPLA